MGEYGRLSKMVTTQRIDWTGVELRDFRNLPKDEKRQAEAAWYADHLFDFNVDVLGYTDLEEPANRELCEFVDNLEPHPTSGGNRLALIEEPRDSFKTTCVTIGHTLRTVARDTNERCLIDNERFENSKDMLDAIKDHIQNNEKFRYYYGPLDSSKGTASWTRSEIIVPRSIVTPVPTISAAGLEVVKVSQHYTLMIVDDLVSDNNVLTKGLRMKTKNHFQHLFPMLIPNGTMIVIGTRWHHDDIYAWIEKNAEDLGFHVLIRSAYNEDGSLFMPRRINEQLLNHKKKTLGPFKFSCQYLNKPTGHELSVFKEEWFDTRWKPGQVDPEELRVTMTWDPAPPPDPDAEEGCRHGITVLGVTTTQPLKGYFLETIAIVAGEEEILDRVFDVVAKYWPFWCLGIEDVAFQRIYKHRLQRIMRDRKMRVRIKPLKRQSNETKKAKISSLADWFVDGTFMLGPGQDDFVDEALIFPTDETRMDVLDAAAYQLDLIQEPRFLVERDTREPSRTAELRGLATKRKKRWPTQGSTRAWWNY
jgi:hypothetical protein